MSYFPDLQFLDLDDVSKEEAEAIQTILYSSRNSSSVVLPWIDHHVDWNQSNYEGETSECSEGGAECYQPGPPPVPVPTSLHQVYQQHGPQVVPTVQLSYLAPASYYPQQPQPHQVYDGGRKRGKASPKRNSGGGPNPSTPTGGSGGVPPSAGSVAPPGPYPPLGAYSYHPTLVPGPPTAQYQYMAGGMPAAQHATGHPLFLTPQIPVYTAAPPHLYSQYPPHQQVYNPALHQGAHPAVPQDRIPKSDDNGTVSSVAAATSPAAVALPHAQQLPATTMASTHHQPVEDINVAGITTPVQNTQVAVSSSPTPLHTPAQDSRQPQGLQDRSQTSPHHHVIDKSTLSHASTDTDSKSVQVEETPVVATVVPTVNPKPLPPQSAIKTTSVPPSSAMKSNSAKPPSTLALVGSNNPNMPAAPVSLPKKDVEESDVPSPTIVPTPPPAITAMSNSPVMMVPMGAPRPPAVGILPLGAVQPPFGGTGPPLPAVSSQTTATPPVQMAKAGNDRTWAALFKESRHGGTSLSLGPPLVQSTPVQHHPTLQNSIISSADSFQSGAKVPNKGPPMSKGPPPQNAVVLVPPPHRLTAPAYHSSNVSHSLQHHAPAGAATPPGHSDGKPGLGMSKVVHPPPGHSVANSQDPVLNKIADLLSEYELEHRAVVLTPRGLNNPSNYCYINATLQALLACAPFYNLVRTLAKIKPYVNSGNSTSATGKSATPIIDSMIQFVNEFNIAPNNRLRKERSEKAQARKDGGGVDPDSGLLPGNSFEPSYVYKMVHNSFSLLQLEDRQEDAEEFLTVLLNGLNDEMIELLKLKGIGLSNGEVTTNGESHADVDSSDWKEVSKGVSRVTRRTEFGRTPLTDIFMGQIRSRVERSDPQKSTDNIQPFFSLHLDVESCETVDDALAKMTSEKAVEGGSAGEQTTTASYIDHHPLVLILHLKCFHYSNGRLTKIAKSIDYPIDLRLGSKLMHTNKSKQYTRGTAYKLFAVVYHEGKEATKGHYLADVFHVGSSCWIRYDDAQVKSVSEHLVLKPKPPRVPYLLLYRRIDKQAK